MLFCVVGLSFRTAPVEVREKLSFGDDVIDDAYRLLLAKEEVQECVIISTCNRVELYAMLKECRGNILKDFFRDFHKYSGSLDDVLYSRSGSEAVRHLCVVASGLDSMVIGEAQIFGQVKEAYLRAVKNKAVSHALDHLFSQVFSVVKKVRSKTRIGEKNLSVSYAAVKLAQSIFDTFTDKRVMILGAGEMGELTVRNLISAGVSGVVVANRTFQKAVEVSERFNGTPIMLHEIWEYFPGTDIIISSITAPGFLIKSSEISSYLNLRKGRPVFLVDISVPRSIDPEVSKLQNVHLYNIDDLRAVVDSNAELRRREAEKGVSIIEKKVCELVECMKSYDILPTLVSIRSKAEEIRRDGLQNLEIPDQQRQVVDLLTKSMVNKILQHSEIVLREYSSNLKRS
ncbi:MAG: glutamyl-tRNA reductase [Fibrobacter sp.]|jgi:glutamyl-tRNA reductase|nr:glutamyl-tRNA reductase [Fibrobacter sp.]